MRWNNNVNMYIKNNNNTIEKILKTTAFSLVEVIAALAISGITLVTLVKISLESTTQSLKNDSADRATQIASNTIDTLLQIKTNSGKDLCNIGNVATSPNDSLYYLIDTSADPNVTKPSITTSRPSTYTNKNIRVEYLTSRGGMFQSGFVLGQDNLLAQKDKDNGFFRGIYITSDINDNQYNIIRTTVIVYWNLYGKDNYYTTDSSFSVADICPDTGKHLTTPTPSVIPTSTVAVSPTITPTPTPTNTPTHTRIGPPISGPPMVNQI